MNERLLEKLYQEKAISSAEYFFVTCTVPCGMQKYECVKVVAALLMRASIQGHLSIDLAKPCQIVDLLELSLDKKKTIIPQIEAALQEFEILWEAHTAGLASLFKRVESFLYFPKNWHLEGRFLNEVKRLISSPSSFEEISISDISLNEEQREAVKKGLTHPFSIITGGPGTGKTYTAAAIVKELLKRKTKESNERFHLILMAPTGKAAAHLEKSILSKVSMPTQVKISAGTIHSLLKIHTFDSVEQFNSIIDADLIIVDECSMIDLRVFTLLLSSIRGKDPKVVLMGDKDQLPPVETGSIFAEIIQYAKEHKKVPYTELVQGMRTAKQDLREIALKINSGSFVFRDFSPSDSVRRQFLGLSSVRKAVFYENLFSYLKPYYASSEEDPLQSLEKFESFRVLNCVRKGPFGVDALNEFLLKKFSSNALSKGIFIAPIIITENNYAQGLFNGDAGIAVYKEIKNNSYDWKRGEAFFHGKDKELRIFPISAIPRFEYGYCLSVHKSQGSEYARILVLCPQGTESFGKEILYTAVTRAKEEIEIDFHDEISSHFFKDSSRRMTGFCCRIEEKPTL